MNRSIRQSYRYTATLYMTQHQDEVLVQGLIGKDRNAIEQLIKHHRGWMLTLAKRMLNDAALAEDCVQESLISAINKINSYEGRSAFHSWLKRIVINHCLMKLRQQKRRNEVNIDDLMPLFDQNECRLEPHWSEIKTPEAVLLEHQSIKQILSSIEHLPSDYRVVLLLRDIEEFSTKEAAKMLDCTESTVKIRLHRARCALKKLLEPTMCGEGKS